MKQAEKAKKAQQMLELKEKENKLRKTYNVPKTPKPRTKSRTNNTSSKRTRPSLGGSRFGLFFHKNSIIVIFYRRSTRQSRIKEHQCASARLRTQSIVDRQNWSQGLQNKSFVAADGDPNSVFQFPVE